MYIFALAILPDLNTITFMVNLSDFDFKNHLTVFQVLIDGVATAHVPLGSLETFLFCFVHANRSVKIQVSLVYDSNDDMV